MRDLTVSPLVLSDTISALTPTMNSPIVFPDLDQLKNPSRTPFLIDEIRFRFRTDSDLAWYPNTVKVRLDLGRLELTAGRFIPLGLFGPPLDSVLEISSTADLVSQTIFAPPIYAIGMGYDGHAVTWRLPKPFYIPAGETIIPQFILDPAANGGVVSRIIFDVSYIGRVLPSDAPIPKYVNVPFINAWIDAIRGNVKVSVRSIRSDLKNPHGEPLFVQRLVGNYRYKSHTGAFYTQMGLGAITNSTNPGGSPAVDCDLVGNDLVTAKVFKSDGRIVARDATPWAHLFPWTTKTLDICSVLRRNEYYQITADIDLSTATRGGFTQEQLQLMASIVGHRKVAYAGRSFQEVG